jgi:NAD(P)-dependent dehydrogenase (short-subunit alcohol dehydrogenase family)
VAQEFFLGTQAPEGNRCDGYPEEKRCGYGYVYPEAKPAPAGPRRDKLIVYVVGGASGIGLGITKSFAEQGAHISVLDVNADGADIVSALSGDYKNASFSFHKCDISNWDEQAAVFEQIHQEQGRIDVVMANAGISREGSLIVDEEKPTKPTLKTLDVNLTGTIYSGNCLLDLSLCEHSADMIQAVKLAIHYLKKNDPSPTKGSIICTASNAGLYPFPVAPIYATSKFGVVGFVRSLARQLEKEHIQINALAPAVLGESSQCLLVAT